MNLFAAMHDCPVLMMRALTAVLSAFSKSALGITMKASLPPSSSTLFLISRAAVLATALPAFSLPVSVTAFTRGSTITFSTRSGSISSVWKTPSWNPAQQKISSMASAHCGTFDACLSSPTLPANSAGPANRNTCQNGSERLILHVTFSGVSLRYFVLQKSLAILGVKPATTRAFLDFCDRIAKQFAHLQRDDLRELFLFLEQQLRDC